MPGRTPIWMIDTLLVGRPFESAVPIVSWPGVRWGGPQDGKASGGPWVRFGEAHGW